MNLFTKIVHKPPITTLLIGFNNVIQLLRNKMEMMAKWQNQNSKKICENVINYKYHFWVIKGGEDFHDNI